MTSGTKQFKVQVHDGEWIDCVREDLIEHLDGRTAHLPAATFDLLESAELFIRDMCGLMHCGGDPSLFRIVNTRNGVIRTP